MRILTVTTSYPRHPGDWAGRFVRDLNAGLITLGHAVTTLAPWAPGLHPNPRCARVGDPGLALEEADQEGGPVRRVTFCGRRSSDLFYGAGAEANARRLGLARSALAFRDATRAFEHAIEDGARRADLVLAHWVFPSAWWAAKAAGGTPILGVVHGADARLLVRPLAGRLAARRLQGRLSGLVCVSAQVRDRIRVRIEVPEDRVVVSPMGIDTRVFRTSEGTPREPGLVAAAGRLVASKGFDQLVAACAGLGARLVIAGEGPERARLARDAAAAGVPLDLVGTLRPEDLAGLFRSATVVAAPSRAGASGLGEGVPLVVLEALACGAAVVGTGAGGIPEVLGAHAVAAGGASSMRDLVRAALLDPDRFRNEKAAARYDRVVVAQRLLGVLAT